MRDLGKDLKERDGRYGKFAHKATIAQQLKRLMRAHGGWELLTNDKREALEQIATKIARILNGDPEYQDSWYDISGYAKLIADGLEVPDGGGDTDQTKKKGRGGGPATGVALRSLRQRQVPHRANRRRPLRRARVR
jgi:hypothetical protein